MIEVEALTRRFGNLTAIDDLSFVVRPGDVLGFLGPNGAGKTTTMKIITGYLAATSGQVRVMGEPVTTRSLAVRRRVGYLPEGAPLYREMTVAGLLAFVARVHSDDRATAATRVARSLERLDLGAVATQRIEALSKGFRRRVGLAIAMLADPPILILDEPTDGLDPNQKHEVRALIRSLASDRIVIVSTHILEEVEAVCSRALVIAAGRKVADATPAELLAQSRWHGAVSLVADPAGPVRALLAGLPDVAAIEPDPRDPRRLVLFARAGHIDAERLLATLRTAGIAVHGWEVDRGRLDDVFRRLTAPGRPAGPAPAAVAVAAEVGA